MFLIKSIVDRIIMGFDWMIGRRTLLPFWRGLQRGVPHYQSFNNSLYFNSLYFNVLVSLSVFCTVLPYIYLKSWIYFAAFLEGIAEGCPTINPSTRTLILCTLMYLYLCLCTVLYYPCATPAHVKPWCWCTKPAMVSNIRRWACFCEPIPGCKVAAVFCCMLSRLMAINFTVFLLKMAQTICAHFDIH